MKINFYCGDYDAAIKHDPILKHKIHIMSFGKKTGADIFYDSCDFFKFELLKQKNITEYNVFSNNDMYLNALRYEVGCGAISSNDVKILYFFKDAQWPKIITVARQGSLSEWPNGFFDGFEVSIHAIMSLR